MALVAAPLDICIPARKAFHRLSGFLYIKNRKNLNKNRKILKMKFAILPVRAAGAEQAPRPVPGRYNDYRCTAF